jgi:hypothetical protein
MANRLRRRHQTEPMHSYSGEWHSAKRRFTSSLCVSCAPRQAVGTGLLPAGSQLKQTAYVEALENGSSLSKLAIRIRVVAMARYLSSIFSAEASASGERRRSFMPI